MNEKVSPLFQLFEKQYAESRIIINSLDKNFRTKKALEMEEKLIFLNIYLHLLNKIHFQEERLKFEAFEPFVQLRKSLKRVHHYGLVTSASEEEKGTERYLLYETLLLTEKKILYKKVYETVLSSKGSDIWDAMYASAYDYSKAIRPLMIETATRQLINEELENITFDGKETLDSQGIREVMEGLQVITAVENIKVALGLDTVFTPGIHAEMKVLLQALVKWHQNYLFVQHFNYFLSENEEVGQKYLELARRIKDKKKRLTTEVAGLCNELLVKLLV